MHNVEGQRPSRSFEPKDQLKTEMTKQAATVETHEIICKENLKPT